MNFQTQPRPRPHPTPLLSVLSTASVCAWLFLAAQAHAQTEPTTEPTSPLATLFAIRSMPLTDACYERVTNGDLSADWSCLYEDWEAAATGAAMPTRYWLLPIVCFDATSGQWLGPADCASATPGRTGVADSLSGGALPVGEPRYFPAVAIPEALPGFATEIATQPVPEYAVAPPDLPITAAASLSVLTTPPSGDMACEHGEIDGACALWAYEVDLDGDGTADRLSGRATDGDVNGLYASLGVDLATTYRLFEGTGIQLLTVSDMNRDVRAEFFFVSNSGQEGERFWFAQLAPGGPPWPEEPTEEQPAEATPVLQVLSDWGSAD